MACRLLAFISTFLLATHTHAQIPLKNTATPLASSVISYPVGRNASGLKLIDVLPIMAEITESYRADIKLRGLEFSWDFDWDKPWLGAGSKVIDGTFSILLWGGFLRADRMTIPALEFTICHELGHLLGGSPHQVFPGEGEHWSSVEGQADWWAASRCLPFVYAGRGLDSSAIQTRTLQAGIEFARFAEYHYDHNPIAVSYEARAGETPLTTLILAYPTLQCRLDTIREGAACASRATLTKDVETRDECARPRCWFVP